MPRQWNGKDGPALSFLPLGPISTSQLQHLTIAFIQEYFVSFEMTQSWVRRSAVSSDTGGHHLSELQFPCMLTKMNRSNWS